MGYCIKIKVFYLLHLSQCSWCLFFHLIRVLDEILCSFRISFAFLCLWQYSSITFSIKSLLYCFFSHQIVNVELQSWQRYLWVCAVEPYLMILFPLHLLQFMNKWWKYKIFYICCFTFVGEKIKTKFLFLDVSCYLYILYL